MMNELMYCPGAAWQMNRLPRRRYPDVGYVLPGRLWHQVIADPELIAFAIEVEWQAAQRHLAEALRKRRSVRVYLH